MKSYYLLEGETQLGPYTLKELKSQAITPDSKVWCQDSKDWIRAGDMKELRSFFPANSTPIFAKFSTKNEEAILPQPVPVEYAMKPRTNEVRTVEHRSSFRSENADYSQPAINPKVVAFSLGLAIVIILSLINFSGNTTSANVTGPFDEQSEKTAEKTTATNKTQGNSPNKAESSDTKNKSFRNNWKNYITQEPGKYKIRGLGGISGLVIYVNNKSDNLIDEVVVNVTYFKSDGSVFEVKEVPFYNIRPHSRVELKVPNTQRGTKVKTEIGKVSSRSYQFCYDSSNGGGSGTSDPWYCR